MIQANWKNRIVRHGEEDAAALVANPLNWRVHHPKAQRDALEGHGATFAHVKEGRRLGQQDAIKDEVLA